MYLARLLLIVHLVFPLCIYLTLDLQHLVQYVWKKMEFFSWCTSECDLKRSRVLRLDLQSLGCEFIKVTFNTFF